MSCLYHPDPRINAELALDAVEAEELDLAAGYPPRRWSCPRCGASHGRGHFPVGAVGHHRCMRCGYAGPGGVMWMEGRDASPTFSADPAEFVESEVALAAAWRQRSSRPSRPRAEGSA